MNRSLRLAPLLRLIQGRERERAVALRARGDEKRGAEDRIRGAEAARNRSQEALRDAIVAMEADVERLARANALLSAADTELETWLERAEQIESALDRAQAEFNAETTDRRRFERAIERWRVIDAEARARREYLDADEHATRRGGEAL